VTPDEFLGALMGNLIKAKNKFPDQYVWPDADVLEVFRRFADSLRSGTYSRHCHAIKWTCRDLKIKNDRASIDAVFANEINERKCL
jgi:hypothetical protein